MASSFCYANSRLWAVIVLVLIAVSGEAIIGNSGLRRIKPQSRQSSHKQGVALLKYSVVGFIQNASFFILYFAGIFAIVNSNIPGITL